jgi:polysaccharide biosynthesis transport protein
VLRETLDTSVSEREDASDSAQAPVLVALAEDEKVRRRPLISEDPHSPRAEAFRQLRTNIRFLSVDDRLRSLVVTSPSPDEGKTTVAANLAIALAQSGEQVILVDADLRRPRVAEVLGIKSSAGLTNVLLGLAHVDSALAPWQEGLPLRVLTSGEIPPNPSEILGSHRMESLLQELLQRANIVIFDSPSLLPVTDAAILSNITDGALLVVRSGKTKREALASGAEAVRAAGSQVLGVVLNRTSHRQASATYRYGFNPAETAPAVRLNPEELAGRPRVDERP